MLGQVISLKNMNFEFKYIPNNRIQTHVMLIKNSIEKHILPISFLKHSTCNVNSFVSARQVALQLATENKSSKISLCLSGGLDSHALLSVFHGSDINFDVYFLYFNNRWNEHDFESLQDTCWSLNIEIKKVGIDILRFFESGDYYDIAVQSMTNSPLFSVFSWLADQIEGIPVFSGQPWAVQRPKQNDFLNKQREDLLESDFRSQAVYIPSLKEYAAQIYLSRKSKKCITHFFQQEECLLKSFWRNPYWINYDNLMSNYSITNYWEKYYAYLSGGFPIVKPTKMTKLTGFERVYFYYQQKYMSDNIYYFNDIYRKPLENIFPKRERLLVEFV